MNTPWELNDLTADQWDLLIVDRRMRESIELYIHPVPWGYRYKSPGIAFDTDNLPDSLYAQRNDRVTNCSTMTASLIAAVFPRVKWDVRGYKDLQVIPREDGSYERDMPIAMVVRHGIGTRVSDFVIGRWHLVQGWWRNGNGHSEVVFCHDRGFLEMWQAGQPAGVYVQFVPGLTFDADVFIAALP